MQWKRQREEKGSVFVFRTNLQHSWKWWKICKTFLRKKPKQRNQKNNITGKKQNKTKKVLVESQYDGFLLQDIFGGDLKLPTEVSSNTIIHSKQSITSVAIICQILRLQLRLIKHAPTL